MAQVPLSAAALWQQGSALPRHPCYPYCWTDPCSPKTDAPVSDSQWRGRGQKNRIHPHPRYFSGCRRFSPGEQPGCPGLPAAPWGGAGPLPLVGLTCHLLAIWTSAVAGSAMAPPGASSLSLSPLSRQPRPLNLSPRQPPPAPTPSTGGCYRHVGCRTSLPIHHVNVVQRQPLPPRPAPPRPALHGSAAPRPESRYTENSNPNSITTPEKAPLGRRGHPVSPRWNRIRSARLGSARLDSARLESARSARPPIPPPRRAGYSKREGLTKTCVAFSIFLIFY